MKREIEIVLAPSDINDDIAVTKAIAKHLNISVEEINAVRKVKRSLDARPHSPVFRLQVDVYINEHPPEAELRPQYQHVENAPPIYIAGFGPAGMFAALRALELGLKPIVFERGKNIRDRRFDLKAIMRDHIVHPDSNYCFGEGGAGTYSDGKLYTRSTKRGSVQKILSTFYFHGAKEDILIDNRPHIGSNKLPKIVESIRNTIINHGGEIHFNAKVTGLIIADAQLRAIIINGEKKIPTDNLILATGHSARDVYELLNRLNIKLESKSFAVGVRIEHSQQWVNDTLYHKAKISSQLPPAAYSLTCQIEERGAFSFCMCPGGIIVPASTSPGEIVLNGMSVSKRNSPFANSGLVISVNENDFLPFGEYGALAGLMYQKAIEQKAFALSVGKQSAPAQSIKDFIDNKHSSSLPPTSYIPGLIPIPLEEVLPQKICASLRQAIKIFDTKMKGFITSEGIVAAPETRTSSPVRIPRDKENYMHAQIKGLFPCGEGAGYAGGIVSSAIDGERCAEHAARSIANLRQ
jgi:uncharacterized FAD-dependent dehydrogenase